MLAVILVCQLMIVLDTTIVNVALPEIQAGLHFSAAGLSWVLNAYTLAFGGLLLLGARSGDLLGRRRTFLAGITLFTAASLAGGLAGSAGWLLAARAIQGVGGALAAPSALAVLTAMFPEGRERMRALAGYTAVSIGGSALGLVAGGLLTAWISWRWVLFVNVPIGVVLVALAARVLPETPRRTGSFDLAGAITSTLGMTALVYGFVHAASDGWSSPGTFAAFAGGIALLVAFLVVETRAAAPITPLHLFTDRIRGSAYLARMLLTAGMLGMFFFLTQFLQGILGYSALRTGFAFLPLTVALFLASQASARGVVERFGAQRVVIGGLTLSVLGEVWLTRLGAGSGYLDVLGPLMLFGLGNGLAFVPLTAAALSGVRPADAGAASGLVNVMQQVGGSLGLSVLVTVFSAASRQASAHPGIAGLSGPDRARYGFVVGADRAFWAASAFVLVSLVLAGIAGRARRAEPDPDPVPSGPVAELELELDPAPAA